MPNDAEGVEQHDNQAVRWSKIETKSNMLNIYRDGPEGQCRGGALADA